ncbi:MAG: copper transport protein [Miltoncostaeaceae bacterium]|nr:copper transport protein [Miltoncostaeaceae bacterium]
MRGARLVALLVALAALSGVASAAPPASVRIAIGVSLDRGLFDGTVTWPSGRRAPLPTPAAADPDVLAVPVGPGADGRYTVAWSGIRRDGRPARGTAAFAIRDGAVGPVAVEARDVSSGREALTVLDRLLVLVGFVGLAGLVGLRALVVGPAWRAGGVAPPVGATDPAAFRGRAAPALRAAAGRWWGAWWALAAAAAAGLVLAPAAVLASAGRGPGDLGRLLGDTRWGTAWIVEVAALAAAAAAAPVLARRRCALGPELAPGWALALGAPPALALVAVAWSGHAAAEKVGLDVAIDAVHNLATAAWLGGLAALAVMLPPALRGLEPTDRTRLAAGVVVRFSALALTAVGALVATGVYRALVELSSPRDLLDTGYGNALLIKLLIFVPLLGAGAYNRMVLHPRLERAAIGLDPGDRGAADRLRRSVRAELALAGALMVAVAALVALPPPA